MLIELKDVLAPALTFVGSVVVAWWTAKNAVSRFYSERWFERKVDAYTKVIEAMHEMRRITRVELRLFAQNRSTEKFADENHPKYRQAQAELARLIDMGVLLFSKDAAEVLDELSEKLEQLQDPEISSLDCWQDEIKALQLALTKLRPIAKADLKS